MREVEKLLNNAQWDILKQAAPHFESARHEYLRNCPKWLSEQVIQVYEDATGQTLIGKNLNCATCVLRIFQTVGKLYFYNLKEREKILNEENGRQIPEYKNSSERDAESKTGDSKKKTRSVGKGSRRNA